MIQACYLEAACEEIERLEHELAECNKFHKMSIMREFEAALDTKPAEHIINAVKAQALREAADAIGSYVISDLALRKRANELENK